MAGAPNVLLVTVDCMRRDRVSAYGYERQTTPFLDGLLDGALHCTSAHSTSSWTAPAVVSMLTGLYPHRHGAGYVPGNPKHLNRRHLPSAFQGLPALPALLPGHDAGVVSSIAMALLPFDPEAFRVRFEVRRSGAVLRATRRALRSLNRPFFLWVHLGHPHDPLTVSRRRRAAFGASGYRRTRRWAFAQRDDDPSDPAFAAYVDRRRRLYDAAIREADTAIAEVWSMLASERERSVLLVTADHGEQLWEHREAELRHFADPRGVAGVGHGQNLWQEILLVPLIVAGAGIRPREIRENASLADVAPTLLEVAGGATPSEIDGCSLLGALSPQRHVLAEGIAYGYEKRAVVRGDRKLLSAPEDDFERVFMLDTRRRESEVDDDPEPLRSLLPAGGNEAAGRPVELTREIEGRLRYLGYLD